MNFRIVIVGILASSFLLLNRCADPLELPEEDNDPCRWTECDTTEEEVTLELDSALLWSSPSVEDTEIGPIYRDDIWLYVNYHGRTNRIEKRYLRSEGVKWVWDELSHLLTEDLFFHQKSNTLIVHDHNERMFAIDAVTGLRTHIYIQREGEADSEGHLSGDHYYHVRYHNFYKGEKFLVRSHVNDLNQWDTLYSVDPSSHESDWIFVEGFQDWVNPLTGDQHLLFLHQGVQPLIDDIVNYNITQDSVEWIANEVARGNDANVTNTFVTGNRLLLLSGKLITCLDLLSKEILWRAKPDADNWFNIWIPPVYLNSQNSLILQISGGMDGRGLVKLDFETGTLQAESAFYEFTNANHFTYFNDHIISFESDNSETNRMLFFDPNTLALKKSLKGKYYFEGPIYIFPEDSILLSASPNNLHAFDLNKLISE